MKNRFVFIVIFFFLSLTLFSIEPLKTIKFITELSGVPAVYKNSIVFLTKRGILRYYNNKSKKHWEYYIENGALSSPSVDKEGNIYVGTLKTGLLIFNHKGELKKRVNISDEIRATPIIYKNKIIVTTMNGEILYLNKKYNIYKKIKINNRIFSSPIFSKSKKSIIVPFKDYLLIAFDLEGRILWRFKTKGVIFSSPAVSKNGNIYLTSMDHYIYKLSKSGKLLWKFKTKRWIISSPVIDKNGNVYFGSYDNNFYCLSSRGKLKWKFKGAGAFNATAVISRRGNIYTGNSAGEIFKLSSEGKPLWRYKTDDFVRIPFTIFKKSLIASSINGSVFYFSIKEGISFKAQWPEYLGNLRNSGYK